MDISSWWLLPLGVAAAGAAGLAVSAGVLQRQISDLHKAMRPLRTDRGRRSR